MLCISVVNTIYFKCLKAKCLLRYFEPNLLLFSKILTINTINKLT